jgi:hypothetical protein
MTLHQFGVNEVKRWAQNLCERLANYPISHVDFYAGKRYRQYLIPLLESNGITCDVPLRGMGIGQQLQFYGGDA